MIEIIGWIGSIAFSLCAIPQAVEAIRNKVCYINKWFLTLWIIGEVFTLVYAIGIGALPMIMNYMVNGACLIVIAYYNKTLPTLKGVI